MSLIQPPCYTKNMIVAVDIGGTKTLVGSFNSTGQLKQLARFRTPQDPHLLFSMLENTLSTIDQSSIRSISIGAPGIVDQHGVIIRCGNLPWHSFHLKKLLIDKYNSPVFIANDADLAGLGEVKALASPPPLAMYVTISTGIGVGLLVNGRMHPAFSKIEAGHMMFETQNGLRTWESFASGRAIRKRYGLSASEIANPATWDKVVANLAVGFRVLIPALQPDIIILGGSVGLQLEKFGPQLIAILAKELPHMAILPTFKKAVHAEESVLYGCYYAATGS